MLRCSCSRRAGSWVAKPGDRQAIPISWMCRPADSREVRGAGRAVWGPREVAILDDRSSRLGRGRAVDKAGEPGSFFTLINGGAPVRILQKEEPSVLLGGRRGEGGGWTHELGEAFPCALDPSTLDGPSGEPLLLARFAAGSLVGAGPWTEEEAMAVKWRGETRSTEGGRVVGGAVATAVDMAKVGRIRRRI
jgi:hypothetical protein